jgi:SAM-dependent methyltransferase
MHPPQRFCTSCGKSCCAIRRPAWRISNSRSLPGASPVRNARPGPLRPYLEGRLRSDFDRWIAESVARHSPPLEFREIRRGVQALSSLYLERRAGADLSLRASDGAGKRAALATYYAPLHFLATCYALESLQSHPEMNDAARDVSRNSARPPPALHASGSGSYWSPRRIWDLGCGTGAVGAALARAFEPGLEVVGIDRSGFALREARHTYRALGVFARTRRGRIPTALPKPKAGDLWAFGFALNEFDQIARTATLSAIAEAVASGVVLFAIEPLAGPVTPWWNEWREALAPFGVETHLAKRSIARPEWLGRLDRASGLKHRVVGARFLAGPLRAAGESAPVDLIG